MSLFDTTDSRVRVINARLHFVVLQGWSGCAGLIMRQSRRHGLLSSYITNISAGGQLERITKPCNEALSLRSPRASRDELTVRLFVGRESEYSGWASPLLTVPDISQLVSALEAYNTPFLRLRWLEEKNAMEMTNAILVLIWSRSMWPLDCSPLLRSTCKTARGNIVTFHLL